MEFKRFKKTVKLNGIEITADIVINVVEDHVPEAAHDFDFGNAAENEAYAKRFTNESGDLFNGVITVTASAFGIEGFDALGGCHLNCNNLFNSDPFERDVNETIETHDMVNEALANLTDSIQAQAALLAPFVECAS